MQGYIYMSINISFVKGMRSHTNLGDNFFLSFRRQDRDNEKEEFRRRTFIVQPAFKYKYFIRKFKNSNVSSDLQSPQEIFFARRWFPLSCTLRHLFGRTISVESLSHISTHPPSITGRPICTVYLPDEIDL